MSSILSKRQSSDQDEGMSMSGGDCCYRLHVENMSDGNNWCNSDPSVSCQGHEMDLRSYLEGVCVCCENPTCESSTFLYLLHPRLKDVSRGHKYCYSVATVSICKSCLDDTNYDVSKPAVGRDSWDVYDELHMTLVTSMTQTGSH